MKRFTKFTALMIALAMMSSVVMGCSEKLPAETLPSTEAPATQPTEAETEPVETETEPVETEPEETEPLHGPFSTAVVTERAVDVNGQLSIVDGTLVNENGEPYQLRGMSSYNMNGIYGFFNEDIVQTLAEDWGSNVLRLAMTTAGTSDGYIFNPDRYFETVCDIVDLCVAQGIYVIVDWHILFDGNPQTYETEAIDFFTRMSAIYGDCPNVIWEICNEPNSSGEEVEVTWDGVIKPYAENVIAAIRANDPDNIIIVGTPTWSHDVDIASYDPITDYDNLMYSVHCYVASEGGEIYNQIQTALDNGVAVFATEWGTTYDSGGGFVDVDASYEWANFLAERNVSWCNWSIGGSVTEASNSLRYISNVLTIQEKMEGHWPDEFISNSGLLVRSLILQIPYEDYMAMYGQEE